MQEVFQKAVDGGLKEGDNWKFVSADTYWVTWLNGNGDKTKTVTCIYFLIPEFWQCLGAVLHWRPIEFEVLPPISPTLGKISSTPIHAIASTKMMEGWEYQMHRFTDHLIARKTMESFFIGLLKK